MSIVDSGGSQRAIAVIQQITERISSNLVEKECFFGRNPEDMPPWGLFFAYYICRLHVRSGGETLDSPEVVKSLRETFRTIDVRWNVAGMSYFLYPFLRYLIISVGVYLQLLEAQEVINTF